MANLTKFLRRLTNDPAALRRFNNDPGAAMKKAGLSEEEHDLIRCRRVKKLSRAVWKEIGSAETPVVFVIFMKPKSGFWNMSDEKGPFLAGKRKTAEMHAAKTKRRPTRRRSTRR